MKSCITGNKDKGFAINQWINFRNLGVPADDGTRIFVDCLPILPSSVQVISLLLQTVVLLEYTEIHEQAINHISIKIKQALMLCKVTHCISANTRPHLLHWGDREMGTANSCTECSQVAGTYRRERLTRG